MYKWCGPQRRIRPGYAVGYLGLSILLGMGMDALHWTELSRSVSIGLGVALATSGNEIYRGWTAKQIKELGLDSLQVLEQKGRTALVAPALLGLALLALAALVTLS